MGTVNRGGFGPARIVAVAAVFVSIIVIFLIFLTQLGDPEGLPFGPNGPGPQVLLRELEALDKKPQLSVSDAIRGAENSPNYHPHKVNGFFKWIDDRFLPMGFDEDAVRVFYAKSVREHSDRASVSNTRLINAKDMEMPWARKTLATLRLAPHLHRKQLEFLMIYHTIVNMVDMAADDVSGIAFGVGTDPLPSALVAAGTKKLVVSDMPLERAEAKAWSGTDQYVSELKGTYKSEYFTENGKEDREKYFSRASWRFLDMSKLPDDLLQGKFSFVTSCSALEHQGTMQRVEDFLVNTARMLKPGGVSVHTTEFLINSLRTQLEIPNQFSVLRLSDVERIAERLEREVGAKMTTRDYFPGLDAEDLRCDVAGKEGYHKEKHWKLFRRDIGSFWKVRLPGTNDLCHTSILIVIVKNK